MPESLAPAGRNIYSYGITKPQAPSERHGKEYAAPLGLFFVWVGGYNYVAPTELKNGSSAAVRTGALIQRQWGRGEGDLLCRLHSYGQAGNVIMSFQGERTHGVVGRNKQRDGDARSALKF